MTNEFEIKNYAAFFHDGELIDVKHHNSEVVLTLESAEIDMPIANHVQLSTNQTLLGNLHLEAVSKIYVDEQPLTTRLKKAYNYGKIFNLDIAPGLVRLSIAWENSPVDLEEQDFSKFEIFTSHAWWENDPTMENPYF